MNPSFKGQVYAFGASFALALIFRDTILKAMNLLEDPSVSLGLKLLPGKSLIDLQEYKHMR